MAKLKSMETISVIILNWFAMIATKVGRQNCSKWNAIFESHVETCIDWTSFNFWFHYFFYQSATQNNGLLCYWPSTQSWRSELYFRCSVPTFLRLMSCSMRIDKKMCSENISTPIQLEHWAIQKWQSCMQKKLFRDQWIIQRIQRLSVAMSAAWVSSKF